WLLALIVVFRFVEAPMMAMLNPMLVDFGFSLSQIGLLFSVFGAIVGIGSALLAGVLIKYIDIVRCLILFGWLRTAVYALLCLGLLYPLLGDFLPAVGLLKTGFMSLMAISVLLILSVRYLTMTALYALFMNAANPDQAGTDFTLFVCVELLVYFIGGAMSGFLVHQFGYDKLFLWLAIGSGVSMLILPTLIKKFSVTDC
ncbi:TPA: MFS transporter, partial [Neisseria meningitidis]